MAFRYRWRTALRKRLPMRPPLYRLVPKGRDCGDHEWYRSEGDLSRCYHCRAETWDDAGDGPVAYDFEALSDDWVVVAAEARVELIRELRREVPKGHVLHGLRCQPVARRGSRDDTIWWLPHREEWALVHLSYQVETNAQWPSTSTYSTWQALVADLSE